MFTKVLFILIGEKKTSASHWQWPKRLFRPGKLLVSLLVFLALVATAVPLVHAVPYSYDNTTPGAVDDVTTPAAKGIPRKIIDITLPDKYNPHTIYFSIFSCVVGKPI